MFFKLIPIAAILACASPAAAQVEIAPTAIENAPLLGLAAGAGALSGPSLTNSLQLGPSLSLQPASGLYANGSLTAPAATPASGRQALAPQAMAASLHGASPVHAPLSGQPALKGRLPSGISAAGPLSISDKPAPADSGATLPASDHGDASAAYEQGREQFDQGKAQDSPAGSEEEAAARLHQQQVELYLSHSRPHLLERTPATNYLIPWTKERNDLNHLYNNTVFHPMVNQWVAAYEGMRAMTKGTPMELLTRTWASQYDLMRRVKRVLEFIDRIESHPPQWTTENAVILDQPAFMLRDFTAAKAYPVDRSRTPMLIIPPNSGHSSIIADFDDGKSIVQTLAASGRPTYSLDWKSAASDNPQLTSDLIANVVQSIDKVGGKVQLIGLSQGGWLATMVASLYPDKVEALYVAGSPIDAARGENDVTRAAKENPIELFNWFVHGMGRVNLYDGETQLEAFMNIGPDGGYRKRYGFWQDLLEHIDDPKYVARAERYANWFYTPHHLSLWFLEVIEKIFKGNQLFHGQFEVQVGSKLQRVDLSRFKGPVVMLEGTKDDITAPAVAERKDLASVVPDPDAAWSFLIRAGFLADTGEDNINRSEGVSAVVEPKTFETTYAQFAATDDPYMKSAPMKTRRNLFAFLRRQKGQTFALGDAISTPHSRQYKRTIHAGHIGLYNSRNAQKYWRQAPDWVDAQLSRK